MFHGASVRRVGASCQCSLAVVLPCPICAEFWREGQQGQPGGFGWERESVQNGSCRRAPEGRQQHKQVRHWHMQAAKPNLEGITVGSLASSWCACHKSAQMSFIRSSSIWLFQLLCAEQHVFPDIEIGILIHTWLRWGLYEFYLEKVTAVIFN